MGDRTSYTESMRATALLLVAFLGMTGCGLLPPREVILLSSRGDNWYEQAYRNIAAASGSVEPCFRISKRAVVRRTPIFADRFDVELYRNYCFKDAALAAADASHCRYIKSASTIFVSGNAKQKAECYAAVEANNGERDYRLAGTSERLMRELGYTYEDGRKECHPSMRQVRNRSDEFKADYGQCVRRIGAERRASKKWLARSGKVFSWAEDVETYCRRRTIDHADRLYFDFEKMSTLWYKDTISVCRYFYEVDPQDFSPRLRAHSRGADRLFFESLFMKKARTGEILTRLDRLPDFSSR